jgi:hypothetical protein
MKVRVQWSYGGVGAEKNMLFTVRSINSLNVESSERIVDDVAKPGWLVVYSLRDQLNEWLPNDICNGLSALETFESDVWVGDPSTGNPTLTRNRLTDTLRPKPIGGQEMDMEDRV